ncbi:MAG: tRNA-dihydrouridine synthase family protein [Candidatus Heimdallarchaeota archaeon]|nr:tRNA-dihydrouridine synthase family protein [Candidatus Heimdallarchaeota archaeon]
MLAPMEKLVDSSFRTICYNYGADSTFTELVRFEGLAKGNRSAVKRIQLPDDTPTYIQFMGKLENKLEKFLTGFEESKGFLGFNFNLGCPSQNYTNQGVGCAMVKRPTKMARLVGIVRDHGYMVNVKMRLGMTRKEKEDKIYIKLIEKVDADFFVVHARYRSESYRKEPDWSALEDCVNTGKSIIANGNIESVEDVMHMREIGCDGIMIGRPALINPLVFAELKGISTPSLEEVWKEYLELVNTEDMNYSRRLLAIKESDLKNLKG